MMVKLKKFKQILTVITLHRHIAADISSSNKQMLLRVFSRRVSDCDAVLAGLQPTSPAYRLQLLELSELTATLLRSMAAQDIQPPIKLGLLQTLQLLSSSSGQRLICERSRAVSQGD